MINIESMEEAEHFVMLDVVYTVSGNEFDRSYPHVQIVNPSNGNSYPDNESNESHPENIRKHKARENQLFTITLNFDTDK